MASPTLSWTSRPPPYIEAPFNSGLLISGRNGTFPWHSGLSGVHNCQHRGLSGGHNNISDLSVRQKDSESLLLCLFFCLFVCLFSSFDYLGEPGTELQQYDAASGVQASVQRYHSLQLLGGGVCAGPDTEVILFDP